MKNIIIVILFTVFSGALTAQLDSFDISEYALPDLDYKRMNANFSFYSNGNFERPDRFFDDKDRNALNFSATAGVSSYRYFNSAEKQIFRSLYTSLTPNVNLTKEVSDQDEERERIVRLPLYLSSDAKYRMYYAPKRFVEYGSDLWINSHLTNSFYEDDNGSVSDNNAALNMNFSPGILWGFGRVEDVTHSWHAIRILDDLDKLNLLQYAPNDRNVLDLANLLSQRDWTRFFDSRLKYMEDFELMADYFETSALVVDRNPLFYASLNDMYLHGVNATRYAGQIFAFGLATHFNPNVNSRESFFNYVQYGAGLEVKYERFKPINQALQFDIELSFKTLALLSESPEDGFTDGGLRPLIVGEADAGFAWYPNTRTSFSSSLDLRISNQALYPLYVYYYSEGLNARLNWSNNLYYYISPRAWISAKLNTTSTYSSQKIDIEPFPGDNKQFRLYYSFNIGFGYAIY